MAKVPTGIRTERGVERRGLGTPGPRQIAPGDLPIPAPGRDPGLRVNPNQFGAQIGGAIQGLAGEIGNIAAAQKTLEKKRERAESGIALKKAETGLREDLARINLEAQGQPDVAATVGPLYDEAIAARRAELEGLSEEALQRFDEMAISLRSGNAISAITFDHNQKVFAIERDANALADEVHKGILAGDLSFEAGMAELRDIAGTVEDVFTADQEAKWFANQRSRAAAAAGERILDRRPDIALDGATFSESTVLGSLIQQESAGDPSALGPFVTVKGSRFDRERAIGLTQVIPSTADEIAVELGDGNYPTGGTREEIEAYLLDEQINLKYGTHYFKKQMRDFDGDVEAALIAYNGGPARARAWLAAGRDDSVIPDETAKYYKEVLGRTEVGGGDELDQIFAAMTVEEQIRFQNRAETLNGVRQRKFLEDFDDHIANIVLTGQGLDGFNLADGNLDEDVLAEARLQEERAFRDHARMQEIQTGPLESARAVVDQAEPVPGTPDIVYQFKIKKQFDEALRNRLEKRRDDPVGYVEDFFPDVRQDYNEAFSPDGDVSLESAITLSIAVQDQLGVRKQDRRAISVGRAEGLVAEINKLAETKSQDVAGFLQNLLDRAGSHDNMLVNDLHDAKLPGGFFLAALNVEKIALAQSLVAATVNAKKIQEEIGSDAVKANDAIVFGLLEPFAKSFKSGDFTGGSLDELDDIRDAINDLANLYVNNLDKNGAQHAYEDIIGDQFHVDLFSGTGFSPIFIDGVKISDTDINDAADVMLRAEEIAKFDFVPFGDAIPDPAGINRQRTIDDASSTGFWVTRSDGLGAVLVVNIDDLPLKLVDADGEPYGFDYADAATIAAPISDAREQSVDETFVPPDESN